MTKTVPSRKTAGGRVQPRWDGHLPGTRAALEAVFRRAVSGAGQASLQERVLAHACEFRAVTANGGLVQYLQTAAERKLAEARFALNEIGAMEVAAQVSTTIVGLQRTTSAKRESALLLKLEQDLLAAGQALDRLIARYASNMTDNSAAPPPLAR